MSTTLHLKNGTIIEFPEDGDDVEDIRGICDISSVVVTQMVRPKIILCSTPCGTSWVYRLFKRWYKDSAAQTPRTTRKG